MLFFMERPSLHYHEWVSVLTLIFVLSFLTIISHSCELEKKEIDVKHYLKEPFVEVYVSGAVVNPGVVRVPHGTTLGAVLAEAKPTQNADLRRINKNSKIIRGKHLKVPERAMVTIFVDGKEIRIPSGTMLKDLSSFIALPEDTDTSKLNKKRRLKDGESLTIPRKGPKGGLSGT